MEFIKSWKFMAIIVGVLAAVAIAGVIYGVATHAEAGLMEGAPTWDRARFPLAVCARPYLDDGSLGDAVSAVGGAVRATNDRLGFSALRMSGNGCDIDVIIGVPAEDGWMDPGGDALLTANDCEARTSNVHGELQSLVIQHELLHCMGLDHDGFASSIMVGGPGRALAPTPSGAFPPRITDSDRASYCAGCTRRNKLDVPPEPW